MTPLLLHRRLTQKAQRSPPPRVKVEAVGIGALTWGPWSLRSRMTPKQRLTFCCTQQPCFINCICGVFSLLCLFLLLMSFLEPDIEDPYDCKKCRMSFPTLQDHRKHIHEVHSKEYHPCPTCGKIFSAPSMLERHMVTHVGGKPFSCGICNKAYQVTSCATESFPQHLPYSPFGSLLFMFVTCSLSHLVFKR